mgnify:CR=1 FL=1|tara:strand:+ start:586 stop:3780 length:3195 start_codon:yes stop_codon:yes gene_type:complete
MSDNNIRELRIDDITNSPRLSELGATVGDKIKYDEQGKPKLIRVWSNSEDARTPVKRITRLDIFNSKRLQELEVEEGDLYRPSDKKILKQNSDSFWKQFAYGADKSKSDLEYAGDWLESNFNPGGRITYDYDAGFGWASDEELFGNDFRDASPERRRELIQMYDERTLLDTYGPYFQVDPSTAGGIIGGLVGSLISPTSLIPLSAPVKIASQFPKLGRALGVADDLTRSQKILRRGGVGGGIGGALGAEYSILQDLATPSQEIDFGKLGLSTTAGIGLGFVAGGAGSQMVSSVAKAMADSKFRKTGQSINARNQINKFNKSFDEATDKGFSRTEASARALNKSKIYTYEKLRSLEQTGQQASRLPDIVTTPVQGRKVIREKIRNDSAVSRLLAKAASSKDESARLFDYVLGGMDTRLGNYSKRLQKLVNDSESNSGSRSAKDVNKVKPFLNNLKTFRKQQGKSAKSQLDKHLAEQRFDAARALMKSSDIKNTVIINGKKREVTFEKSFEDTIEVLNRLGNGLKTTGHNFDLVTNYFPRQFNNYKEWRASLPEVVKNKYDKALEEYSIKHGTKIDQITDLEKNQIFHKIVNFSGEKKPRDTVVSERTFDVIPEDVWRNYSNSEDALTSYIRKANHSIARAELFGTRIGNKGIEIDSSTGGMDIIPSIRKAIDEEVKLGKISKDDVSDIIGILETRFTGGETAPHKVTGGIRTLGYLSTIANPISAITQIGDLANSGFAYGFKDTITEALYTAARGVPFGIGSKLTRRNFVGAADLGIERASLEMGNVAAGQKILDFGFRVSTFRAMDRLGKGTIINNAINKNRKLVQTTKGIKEFKQKWGEAYGDEIDDIVAQFQRLGGKRNYDSNLLTEGITSHAFAELAEIQPISMFQASQFYGDKPNGRLLFMLQSFTLKQWDIVRRKIYQEAKKPGLQPKINAAYNLGKLSLYLGAANFGTQRIKDFVLGRDNYADNIPLDMSFALSGAMGIGKYNFDRYLSRGDIKGAVLNTVVPPLVAFETLQGVSAELFEEEPDLLKEMKGLPLLGNIIYNFFGGGIEKYNDRLRKQQ